MFIVNRLIDRQQKGRLNGNRCGFRAATWRMQQLKQNYRGNLSGEISGSIGDLGTFLPYIIGAITIGGLDATGVFFTFGLLYILSGWFYRVPVPVQPMKVMGAAILVHQLTAGEVAAAG